MATSNERATESSSAAALVARGAAGGVLMGLANLVPGISGGTMLLATGVYQGFVKAVAEITRFRFRLRSLLLLGSVVAAAGMAILLLAGPVKDLVVDHRWVMYSLFVGLTLGGVPLVWRMAKPATGSVWIGAAVGFAIMLAIALASAMGLPEAGRAGGEASLVLLFLAGLAGAGAMILPGVSGAYLLIVLGQYEIILGAIARVKGDTGSLFLRENLEVILPVGIGVVVGVVVVSNLVRWALEHRKKPTLGLLLGLLVGAVPGIWPFRQGVRPVDQVDLAPEKWPLEFFQPSPAQLAASLGLVVAGLLITLAIDRLGGK